MADAGLTVREDVMGNIFGRWQGSNVSSGAQAPHSLSLQTPSAVTTQSQPHGYSAAACVRQILSIAFMRRTLQGINLAIARLSALSPSPDRVSLVCGAVSC